MNKKKHGFSLIELLVVLLILGILVGLAVPQYLESQKSARIRTFSANIRQIIDALELYKLDNIRTLNGRYPADLMELKYYGYFKQEPINPYTGASMLSGGADAGIVYEATSNGKNYTLTVTQVDDDDLDRDTDAVESLCTIEFVVEMLPGGVCGTSVGSGDLSSLLAGFTYESRIDGFTPRVTNVYTQVITGTVNDVPQTATLIIPVIEPPSEIVMANYKVVMFSVDDPYLNEFVNSATAVFGANNVTVLDWGTNVDAFLSIGQVLSPFNNPNVTIPLAVILDEDGTLLAVFDWPYSINADQLFAIATLGKGYSGVYSPLPVFSYNVDPQSFTLLTDQQKRQIRDALLPVYPGIRTNVD